MKIFYITTTVHIGTDMREALGGTTHTFFLAREFVRAGHEVHVVSKKFAQDKDHEVIDGVHIHRVNRGVISSGEKIEHASWKKILRPFKFIPKLFLVRKITGLMEKYDCEVIIERGHSLGVGAVISYISGIPLYLETIDHIYSIFTAGRAKKIFAYTDIFFKNKNKAKYVRVDSGYDENTFYPKDAEKIYDLCYVGSFKEWDGVEDLVKSIEILVKEKGLVDIKAVLVGDGVRFNKIASMIKERKLDRNIDLTGRIEISGVNDYINKSKVCVAPYNIALSDKGKFDKYGFYYSPLKIFEYLGAGKPVVAPDYEIITNIISQENGAIYNAGDCKDMAENIYELLVNRDLNKIEVKNKMLAQKYTWKEVAEEMLEMLPR